MEWQIPLALRIMHKYEKRMAGGHASRLFTSVTSILLLSNAILLDRAILGLASILSKVSFQHSYLLAFESPIATNTDLLSLSSLVNGGSVWGIAKTVSHGARWLTFL